ncbi:HEPN domain-containing protein [Hydrogenothermus marinus]|uniref:Uncharacterized protein (UPF0332 family) n=1 Tax=Hydrogenothermus marinus TaxID=133270 RepID=A0A3M0BL02_9AQUI|nr:HEPN domain-containing protein [Hydrogenothermus marinus]RMA97931.1 uncharacterized protein (UPF0332 family) [Hydrogenothermus marinus]
MDWKNKWLNKAKEHYKAGLKLYNEGFYRDSLSRLYYSAYSLMVAECGKAPTGRWTHKGILKPFFKSIYLKEKTLSKTNSERLKEFYERRRIADYELDTIEKEEVKTYIELIENIFEVVKND